MAAARLAAAAHMSGVCWYAVSRAFTAAPRPTSRATVAESPLEAAKCSGVAPPDEVTAVTTAPASSSARTATAWP